MHVGNLDIVMRVRVDVGIHARLCLECLQIVCVCLKHVLYETLHCICEIYCDLSSPFLLHISVVTLP